MIVSDIAEKFGYDNVGWYREFLLRLRYNFGLENSEVIAPVVARALNEAQGFAVPPLAGGNPQELAQHAQRIAEDGYVGLGLLADEGKCADVLGYLEDKKAYYDWDHSVPEFDINAAPPQVSVASYRRDVVMNAPHLVELANHPMVIGAAARYLGVMPTLMGVQLFWSLANRNHPEHAQLFHTDRHCYRFCKLFIYLTDVDEEAGPHVYVRGTGSMTRNIEHARRKAGGDVAAMQRYQEVLDKQRKTDAEIEDLFGPERVQAVTGPAGSALLGNTGCIHKGLLPKTKNRLIFQALYTMMPSFKDPVEILPAADLPDRIERLYPGAYTRDQIRYVNRLVAEM